MQLLHHYVAHELVRCSAHAVQKVNAPMHVRHSYRSWIPVHVLGAQFPLSGALLWKEWLIRTVDYELEFVINV